MHARDFFHTLVKMQSVPCCRLFTMTRGSSFISSCWRSSSIAGGSTSHVPQRRAERHIARHSTVSARRKLPSEVHDLKSFMTGTDSGDRAAGVQHADEYVGPASGISEPDISPSLSRPSFAPEGGGTVYLETYGCQMNASDSEILLSVLNASGYAKVNAAEAADLVLLNTCAIRDNAEQKVFHRLRELRNQKLRTKQSDRQVVGVLGCMAERLKTKLLEDEKTVDIVAGPDAYRDLPRLIAMVRGDASSRAAGRPRSSEQAVNVQLSQDETYADIIPTRQDSSRVGAFVSIMRGCNNMCSFCIVPFTRGRERSRPADTVIDEVKRLQDEGFKEVTLLGQNVNSYHDSSTQPAGQYAEIAGSYQSAQGFSNMYRNRDGDGVRFVELLERVSSVAPELRIRFTSSHPKDYPDHLLQLIAERPNLCSSLHIPAQSGSSAVLKTMRRGYTREAYLALAQRMRETIPGVSLSTDMIAGFCGETEEDHQDTLSLMRQVQYEQAFMFAYSKRDRTHAAYKLNDDVPEEVKQRRLREVIEAYRACAAEGNKAEIGKVHLVLVEGLGKRHSDTNPELTGRTDTNKRTSIAALHAAPSLQDYLNGLGPPSASSSPAATVPLQARDYVAVKVISAGVQTLRAIPLARTTISEFNTLQSRLTL